MPSWYRGQVVGQTQRIGMDVLIIKNLYIGLLSRIT
jgi:hypothetical protein